MTKYLILLLVALFSGTLLAQAQLTNSVTGGNTIDYTINGLGDPPFTFQRGVTYVFLLSNVAIHPFWIKSVLGGNFSGGTGAFNTGVVNNGAASGNVTFTVPDHPEWSGCLARGVIRAGSTGGDAKKKFVRLWQVQAWSKKLSR